MKVFRFQFLILSCLLLTSCVNPLSMWTKSEKKVDATKEKIQVNKDQTTDLVKNYTYGANLALQYDMSPNKYNLLARDFTSKANVILGNPTIEEVNLLKEMIGNLLSENKKEIEKGKKQSAEMDEKVAYLQREKQALEGKLDIAEKKLGEVGEYNSGLANTWAKIKSWFFWIFWIFIIGLLLKLVSQLMPPPYNSAFGIISMPIGIIIRLIQSLMPDVKKYAKVVDEKYKTTVEHLVTAVDEIKANNPQIKDEIRATLLQNTDSDTSQKIISKTKEELDI